MDAKGADERGDSARPTLTLDREAIQLSSCSPWLSTFVDGDDTFRRRMETKPDLLVWEDVDISIGPW